MHATPRPLKFLTMLTILLAATLLSQLSPLHSQHGKAEDFVLYSIDGKRTVFYEMLQSLPGDGMLLVNFTSIHCKPCRREIPQLVRIAAGAPARARLVIVYAEGARQVRPLATELGILDRTCVDPFGNAQKLYGVTTVPVTFIVAKDRTVVGRFDGYTDEHIRNIERIVSGK